MEEQPKPPEVPEAILLLREIRDGIRALVARAPKPRQQVLNLVDEGLPEIAKVWNRERDPSLAAVVSMDSNGARAKACRARWAETKAHDKEAHWVSVVHRLNRSDFCLGKAEGTRPGWKADLDFLCRPDQHNKILEGKYDNKAPVPRGGDLVVTGYWTDPEGVQHPVMGTAKDKALLEKQQAKNSITRGNGNGY